MTCAIFSLEHLYAAVDGLHMECGWHRRAPSFWPEPRKNLRPAIWRYKDIKPLLDAAGTLVDTKLAERRNFTLTNPAEGNTYATVRTLVAAYQMIRPGETAEAHRHTPNALRLILEGAGTFTIVDGKRVEMRPGDVLLTPSWAWHSHENVGNNDCYWIDVLDVPLVHLLEPMFFQHHPDGVEKTTSDLADAPIVFRREDILKRLSSSAESRDGVCSSEIELGNPALKTIGLSVQRLDPQFEGQASKTTANSIIAIIEGSGETITDGGKISWTFGDIFAVPSWCPFTHRTTTGAILLNVSDRPVFEAFDLLRREAV